MSTTISGDNGVSQAAAASVNQASLAANVAGTGPAFLARKTAISSITSSTNTVVICNEDIFDTDNAHDNSTGKFQPTVAGYYQVNAMLSINTTGTIAGWTGPAIRKNGVGGASYPGAAFGGRR